MCVCVCVCSADFHRCNKALSAKDQDVAPCDWYQRVYKSLCPMSWVCNSTDVSIWIDLLCIHRMCIKKAALQVVQVHLQVVQVFNDCCSNMLHMMS